MRCCIFGKSGRGKSWYAGWLIGKAAPKFSYACHFDIEDEERGMSMKGNALFRTLYIDAPYYEATDVDVLKTAFEKYQRLRIVPDGLNDEEQIDLLGMVCDAAMELAKPADKDFWLSVDEAHLLAPKHLDDRISRVATGGRKRGIEWCFISQRPANLAEDIMSQTTDTVYFQVTKDRDLKKIDKSCGFDADVELPPLGKRKAIHENEDSGEINEINTEDLTRDFPHVAADDGKADDILRG